MLNRLYVNNYKCLSNFEFNFQGNRSGLLIGGNGSGKSTLLEVLRIFQRIACGDNSLERRDERGEGLISSDDFGFQGTAAPMRFEIEAELDGKVHIYELALEFPDKFNNPRVKSESLSVDGTSYFTRELGSMGLAFKGGVGFSLDWHLIGLPIVQCVSETDPVSVFRNWLRRMVLLAPIPSLMNGEARQDGDVGILPDGGNMAAWMSNILSSYPSSYGILEKYLKNFFPDFKDFIFNATGKNRKELEIRFSSGKRIFSTSLPKLSDGEKCLLLGAAVAALASCRDGAFCFWYEPNNFLSSSQLDYFIRLLRSEFENNSGQFLAISHDLEIIGGFSDTNTWMIDRKGHTEPTLPPRSIEDLRKSGILRGDLARALVSGDIYE